MVPSSAQAQRQGASQPSGTLMQTGTISSPSASAAVPSENRQTSATRIANSFFIS